MADPLSAEEYRERLDRIDRLIDEAAPYVPEVGNDAERRLLHAIANSTQALRAIAQGLRLLAEPPEQVTSTGDFHLFGDDESEAHLLRDEGDPRD